MRKSLKGSVIASATVATLALVSSGSFEREAAAQVTPPTCASLPNPVYIAGSSAVRNVLQALGAELSAAADPTTLVYSGVGSCDGVNTIVTGLKTSASTIYWPAGSTTSAACTPPAGGQVIDVGMADVFPTSCPGITTADLAGVGDFAGPVQSMNFVVPKAATQVAISAEAAYLTFGLGAAGKTDWNNPSLYKIRNFQSGTETMIALAINVPTNKWLGVDQGGSGAMVTAIANATVVDKTIGILASNEADIADNRVTVKRLAFQPYGEACPLYPDSSFSSRDKANVRNGAYQIWGPLHILTKVNAQGEPTNPRAKALIDTLLGVTVTPGVDVVRTEIEANTVPQCAMRVSRSTELGKPKAYSPVGACGCFFDSVVNGSAPSSCKSCTTDAQCPATAPVCSHTFCEAK